MNSGARSGSIMTSHSPDTVWHLGWHHSCRSFAGSALCGSNPGASGGGPASRSASKQLPDTCVHLILSMRTSWPLRNGFCTCLMTCVHWPLSCTCCQAARPIQLTMSMVLHASACISDLVNTYKCCCEGESNYLRMRPTSEIVSASTTPSQMRSIPDASTMSSLPSLQTLSKCAAMPVSPMTTCRQAAILPVPPFPSKN